MARELAVVGVAAGLEDPTAALRKVQSIARSGGGWAQILDAGHVAGRDHLVSACEHARRAFERGTNAAASIEVEFLLYASGERQIAKAINLMGVRPGKPFILVLADGPRPGDVLQALGWARDDGLLESGAEKLRALGFGEAEIAAADATASDLVLELIARVDLAK